MAEDGVAGLLGEREADVRRALARVDDPELDEPVTDLRFIERVEIDAAGAVSIGFRLPTYWCAANFAFLMADDMRREVSALPWVTHVQVVLGEHMYAEKINHGMAAGLSFRDSFGEEASGELHDLRRNFLVKAFQRRQEALLRHLLDAGYAADEVVSLTLEGLGGLDLSEAGRALRRRYLERRDVCAGAGEMAAFVDAQGSRLIAGELPVYLQALGRIGVNAEFNGALCRGLLAARFDETVSEPNAEPGLRDFVTRAAAGEKRGPQGGAI
jgi:metal-sulfur cluster biosynthetic enzyme